MPSVVHACSCDATPAVTDPTAPLTTADVLAICLPKCSIAEGGYVSYQLVGGRIVGRSLDYDELLDIAIEEAPARPPRGWTFDDWRMRGFVPDPCPVRPTNAD